MSRPGAAGLVDGVAGDLRALHAAVSELAGSRLQVRATPFAIPYRTPLSLSAGSVGEYCGVLVEVTDGTVTGVGEEAPDPGSGRETAAEIARRIRSGCPTALSGNYPGVEAALFDWLARRRDEPLGTTLVGLPMKPIDIAVNAMIPRGDENTQWCAIEEAIAAGYRCVKLKLGSEDLETCAATVRRLRDTVGDSIAVRLDCNRSWSLEEARAAIERLADLGIEYIEDPTGDQHSLCAVHHDQKIPIAAEEWILSDRIDVGDAFLFGLWFEVLVLKPSRSGLHFTTSVSRTACSSRSVDPVITSNLETSIGIAAAAHVAALIDQNSIDPTRAHGLGTAGMLAGDLVRSPLIPRAGRLQVPPGPGSGIEVAPELLEKWRID